ncbi:MAG TPA: hypothetical protein VFE51_29880 [Verrucomicrobiae bacterium]|nr:hypothetical protein [Verrucomicrobiae bacterium]
MQLGNLLNLKSRTKFRLRLEVTIVAFSLLAFQVLLEKPSLLELLITLLALLWIAAGAREMKTRHEPFTRIQKRAVFTLDAFIFAVLLGALLIAVIETRTPLVWIAFGLFAVFLLTVLFIDYKQLYRSGNSA